MIKQIATLLVFILFIVYVTALQWLPEYPVLYWVIAFSEAALIGALADWFAVVALFRRPLGIPFPHAAVLPRSKRRIGRALGTFLADNFLARGPLQLYINSHRPLPAILSWLRSPELRARMAQATARVTPQGLRLAHALIAGPLGSATLERIIKRAFRSGSLQPIIETFSALPEQPAFTTECLRASATILEHHQDWIHDIVSRELPWWVPSFVHTSIYRTTLARLIERLRTMANDPTHPDRSAIYELLRQGLSTIQQSAEAPELFSRAASSFLSSTAVRDLLLRLLTELEHSAPAKIAGLVEELLAALPDLIESDPQLEQQLSAVLSEILLELGELLRPETVHFISQTFETWDDTYLSDKLEQEIGPDLQYIRINGTFVGGALGLLLALLRHNLNP